MLARGNQHLAGQHGVAIGGFLYFHGALRVQAVGKAARKVGRHVLHDQYARAIARQQRDDRGQRLHAARA